jgi:hypothetical protein
VFTSRAFRDKVLETAGVNLASWRKGFGEAGLYKLNPVDL